MPHFEFGEVHVNLYLAIITIVYLPNAMKENNLPTQKKASNVLGGSGFDDHAPSQLMAAPAFQLKAGSAENPPAQLKGSSSGLSGDLLNGFASSTGHDLSDVKVHKNSDKPAQVGALAYAQGNDIHLASGQEQHLAHEAAHVVQQREGRVQANTQVGGMPVNDQKHLEHEADAMGEKASQMKAAPSGDLKKGSSSGISQMKAVMQRKVTTAGGDFNDTKYHPVDKNGAMTSVNKDMTGVKMELDFDPGASVDAEQIGMVQSVITKVEGSRLFLSETGKKRSIPVGEHGAGIEIDQDPGNRNPLYAVEGAPATDTKLTDTGDNAGFGQHGHRYIGTDKKVNKKVAKLLDTPNIKAHKANSKQVFEATALAIKGKQTGTYYGSVQWGWETDAAGTYTKLPLKVVSEGTPSEDFLRAGELWNASKTPTGKSTLGLPLPKNIVVTTQDTQFMSASKAGKKLADLPKGSRLDDLGDRENGMAKVKVEDGKANIKVMHQTGWVSATHFKDER
jgi:Domain of unknown function (DUF4157)